MSLTRQNLANLLGAMDTSRFDVEYLEYDILNTARNNVQACFIIESNI